jgi:hypothetical protein
MVIEDGNTPSASPTVTPRTSNASSDATNEELPIEITERNLSDGFLQLATEIEHLVEVEEVPCLAEEVPIPIPTLYAKILACFGRVLGACFKK